MTEDAGVRIRIGARQLSRRFGPVVAVDRVDLAVAPGTIHAVVGGNGAGKSTLMRILQGVDSPDEGSVILNDAPVRLTGPADAFAHGIGMVHQEFMLAPPLTLLENLILAHEPLGRGGLIDWRAARAEADRLAKIAGVAIDWRSRVSDAPVHVRQVLEILRLLYRGVDVLILDEPTAVLAPAQVTELIALMRRLKGEGRTLLFISHKLDEVMRAADAITVMRAGRVVTTTTPAETDMTRLARAMVGETVEPARIETRARRAAAPLFAAKALVARDRGGVLRLGPIDLEVHAGEIVGVAAVSGNGQDELVASAVGLRPIASGTIAFAGTPITNASTGRFRSAGIGYLSADRADEGLCLVASIRDNFVAGREGEPPFSRLGLLRPAAIDDRAKSAMAKLSVRYRRSTDEARSLSGGNQQRLVIAREFDREPKLLVAAQPTRGVDISGIAFIHERIAEFRDSEGAVLLISEEIDEILALSDRIIGLYGGVVVGELGRGEASVEKVGRMMLGQKAA
jgi:simple sugar transport system ATP-binding protein